MTESMTRKDGIELYDSERIYELELSLTRKEALLREAVSEMKVLTSYLPNDLPNLGMTITVKAYAKLVEHIERELKG